MKRIKEPTTTIKSSSSMKRILAGTSESINLLPVATSQYVGGVKIGTGVSVTADGTISVSGGGTTISPGNPTASVGLAEVNGTATTYMRSDAAPKLDQSISPTWTGTHTYSGSIIVPTQTKGDNSTKAASTAFVSSAIAGIAPVNGANPSAKVGTQAVNGTATTYMRSDAAPALDLSISPTWTGAHTYSGSISVPTQNAGDSSTKAASTSFVSSAVQTAVAGIPKLQPATASVLGGVKIGSGITVQTDGTISVSSSQSISPGNPTATVGLTAVDGSATTYMRSDAAPALDQTINPTWSGTHTFSGSIYVPTASQGDNSTKAASTAFVTNAIASIPEAEPATTQSLGLVQIGDNINVQNGVISVAAPYVLPIASSSALGGIKVGSGLNIDSSTGILSASGTVSNMFDTVDLGNVIPPANPYQIKALTTSIYPPSGNTGSLTLNLPLTSNNFSGVGPALKVIVYANQAAVLTIKVASIEDMIGVNPLTNPNDGNSHTFTIDWTQRNDVSPYVIEINYGQCYFQGNSYTQFRWFVSGTFQYD